MLDEAAVGLLHALAGLQQLARHLVEAPGQVADLVPRGVGDGLGEIAVGDPDRAVDEPVEGPGDAPGQEGRPGDAEEEAADADEQEDLLDLPQPGVHRLERQADLDRAPAAGRPGEGGRLDLEDPDRLALQDQASSSPTRLSSGVMASPSRLVGDELAVRPDLRVFQAAGWPSLS